jgi:hypothetical protein
VEPHAAVALFTMLHELKDELPTIDHFYENTKDKTPSEFTKDDFKRMCTKLTLEARDLSMDSAKLARDKKSSNNKKAEPKNDDKNKNQKSEKKSDGKEPKSDNANKVKKWKNSPPKEKSI